MPAQRFRSTKASIQKREDTILALLADGERSTQDICTGLGLSWPAQLEKARYHLNYLLRQGHIIKSIRPNNETRIAYYSLPNGTATGLPDDR